MLSVGTGYALALLYFATHVFAYFMLLRPKRESLREHSIFGFHVISASLYSFTCIAVAMLDRSDTAVAIAGGLIALHGIYSITFLELWSLAQGSFSLQILKRVALSGNVSEETLVRDLSIVGWEKTQNRTNALLGMGLIRNQGGHLTLTSSGRVVSCALRALLHVANYPRSE
jgi:hypothetical protein